MSTSSTDDEPSAGPAGGDEDVASAWVVRLLLVLAFGLAFGIEGMTLIRSYVLGEDEGAAEERIEEGRGEMAEEGEAVPLQIGDDLLPATAVSERVAQMKIRARSGGPWVFRLVVAVVNDGESNYRLSVQRLETDDGQVFEEGHSIECAPGDSTRLVATWPVGADARPESLTAEAELQLSSDSARTASRRVSFGHVPVQMER